MAASSNATSSLVCCWSISSAKRPDSPARRSGATPASAAPARCFSTASPCKSCTCLAVQADGRPITTIEGLAADGKLASGPGSLLEQARPAVRVLHAGHDPGVASSCCGSNPKPTDEQIRHGLEGNICRCTGYQNIVRAVRDGGGDAGGRDHERQSLRLGHPPARRPAPHHRHRHLHRRHRAAGHGARRHAAQSACARAHHAHRHVASAKAAPGVLAVYTGADTAPALKPMPCAWLLPNANLKVAAYPQLAKDIVRYVGDMRRRRCRRDDRIRRRTRSS